MVRGGLSAASLAPSSFETRRGPCGVDVAFPLLETGSSTVEEDDVELVVVELAERRSIKGSDVCVRKRTATAAHHCAFSAEACCLIRRNPGTAPGQHRFANPALLA